MELGTTPLCHLLVGLGSLELHIKDLEGNTIPKTLIKMIGLYMPKKLITIVVRKGTLQLFSILKRLIRWGVLKGLEKKSS